MRGRKSAKEVRETLRLVRERNVLNADRIGQAKLRRERWKRRQLEALLLERLEARNSNRREIT